MSVGKSKTIFKIGRMIHGCSSLTGSTIAPFFIISLDTEENLGHAKRLFGSVLKRIHSINHSKAKCRCRFDRKCQSHNQCIPYRREACIIYSTEEGKMKLCRREWNLATEGVQLTVWCFDTNSGNDQRRCAIHHGIRASELSS